MTKKMKMTMAIFTILLCAISSSALAMRDAGPCKNNSDCPYGALCRWWGGYNSNRCIIGEQNDYCDKKYAGKGSRGCDGSLKCRQVRSGASFFDKGEWACVGRGEQNDLCPQQEVGTGSGSCGGSLTCRRTGNRESNCIGRGRDGDLCSEEEAGRGSWNCGGSLKCRQRGDGKYRCH